MGVGTGVIGAMKFNRYGTRLDYENISHGRIDRFHNDYPCIFVRVVVTDFSGYYKAVGYQGRIWHIQYA